MLPLLVEVSYTTVSPLPYNGGLLSAALSIFSRIPPVRWHYALRCPDFPLDKNRVIIQSALGDIIRD